MNDWKRVEFFVPITEKTEFQENKDFHIRGVAIYETTTRNNVTYKAEELEGAAGSLRDKPILKDHEAKIDNIVGRTTSNVFYDAREKNIKFEARITDESIKKKIDEGLIKNVSIGCFINEMETKESSGKTQNIARGIEFCELSLVAIPAAPNAGFAMAMAESFRIKESLEVKSEEISKPIKEEIIMVEESKKIETPDFSEKLNSITESNKTLSEKLDKLEIERVNDLKEQYITLATERGIEVQNAESMSEESLKAVVSNLRQVIVTKEEAEETPVEEPAEEEKAEEPEEKVKEEKLQMKSKSEVSVPAAEESNDSGFIIEKSSDIQGIGLYKAVETLGGKFVKNKNYAHEGGNL